jgi:glycosyltransferase involved in cell wall biosynthesis
LTAVHQFVPTLEPSAVGTHILEVRRLCEELGWRSEVFAEHVRPALASDGRDFRDYGRKVKASPDDLLLYHVAIGSTVADFVTRRPERVAVDHHNITPVGFFAGWEPDVVHGLAWGRHQLAGLAGRATAGIADSAYNARELDDLGYRRTAVVPIMLDLDAFDRAIDDTALARLQGDHHEGAAWLFVSRLAPNKCQHDVIKAFAAYRRVYDRSAVLRLVGAPASTRYADALRRYASDLGVADAVELTGSVSDGELAAHYRVADVYVCLSEHEGFGLTVLEALHHRVPVVAFASSAVPETLGDGGVCLESKDGATVAAAVDRVLTDDGLRASLIAAGHARLAEFALPATRARMRAALEAVLA